MMNKIRETMQVMYNIGVSRILRQGKRSQRASDKDPMMIMRCAYRGIGGTACFVGALMSDEAYEAGCADAEEGTIEGLTCTRTEILNVLSNSGWDVHHVGVVKFLVDAQIIHDIDAVEEWGQAYGRLARKYELNDEASIYGTSQYDASELSSNRTCSVENTVDTESADRYADRKSVVDGVV